MGLIPGLKRSPEGGNGSTLQYACLESLMDREAWWATVHGFTKSWTRLKCLSRHAKKCLQGYLRRLCYQHWSVYQMMTDNDLRRSLFHESSRTSCMMKCGKNFICAKSFFSAKSCVWQFFFFSFFSYKSHFENIQSSGFLKQTKKRESSLMAPAST